MPSYKYLADKTPTENLYLVLFGKLPEHDIETADLPELHNVLNTLTKREADVITRHFGISRIDVGTFEEIFCMETEFDECDLLEDDDDLLIESDDDLLIESDDESCIELSSKNQPDEPNPPSENNRRTDKVNEAVYRNTPRETYGKIAESYGVSASAISVTGQKALKKLRHPYRAQLLQKLFIPPVELRTQIRHLDEEIRALAKQISKLESELALERIRCNKLAGKKAEPAEADVNSLRIEDLELSARAANCILRHGITTLGELMGMSRDEVSRIRNLGKRAFDELEFFLKGIGLSLHDDGNPD